jgi:hemoglobin
MDTIFERLGGEAAVMLAIPLFYEKVLADDRLARFFSELDMDAQTKKQVSFMSRALGGPTEHHGKALGPAHKTLVEEQGLGDKHFDALIELLVQTLSEMGIDEALCSDVTSALETTRGEVLGR